MYTVGYRVLSTEGHPVTGTVLFRYTGTGTRTSPSVTSTSAVSTTSAPPAAGTAQRRPWPPWLWLVAALPLLAMAALLILRAAGHRSPQRGARR